METLVRRVNAEQLELKKLLAQYNFELIQLQDLDNCGVNEYAIKSLLNEISSYGDAFNNYTTIIGKHNDGGLFYLLISDNNIFRIINTKSKYSIRPLWSFYQTKNRYEGKEPNYIGVFTDKKINTWLDYSKEVIKHFYKDKEEVNNHVEKIKRDTEVILNRLKPYIKYNHSDNNKIYEFGNMFTISFNRDNSVGDAKYQFKINMYYSSNIIDFLDLLGK